MALLIGPDVPETIAERADVQNAAQALGQQVVVAQATTLGEVAAAFTAFVERGAGPCSSAPALSPIPTARRSSRWPRIALFRRTQSCSFKYPLRSRVAGWQAWRARVAT